MPLLNSNKARGLPEAAEFQVGRSDVDADAPGAVEQGLLLPWPSEPAAGWVYYDCTVGVMLDSGIVVHHRLPQVDNAADTLSSCDMADPRLDVLGTASEFGVNLKCADQYEDIVQRMGHSRYWFRLWGQALRVGLQVPIPGLKTVGGVPAIPYDKNPQWAFNRIAPGGNYGGIILWHAAWSLWYTTAVPPRNSTVPIADPAAHISAAAVSPRGIQTPYSQPDDNAVKAEPPLNAAPRDNVGGFFNARANP